MLLCYITDRSQFPGDEASRRHRLLQTIFHAARCGLDYIQLREKDMSSRDLETLTSEILSPGRTEHQRLRAALLINSRTEVAIACGAAGVHLRSTDISPAQVRKIWKLAPAVANRSDQPVIGVSCHSPAEVARAAGEGADFVVFGPVFEKMGLPYAHPGGVDALHQACRAKIPVLALGGVTLENAAVCLQAGAAGIAGIRLFQQDDMAVAVAALRRL